jgi:GNAT superfamily N-acetyltransferase
MHVHEYWKCGNKFFVIDLGDGEARMSLSPSKRHHIDLQAYGVHLHPHSKVFYVDFLKVSPAYRNKGYGKELLKAAMRWADIAKNILILDAIPIDTGMDNHRLIRFYLTHGFRMADGKTNKHSMYYHNRKTKRSKKKPEKNVKSRTKA